jgi:hypothetical protein
MHLLSGFGVSQRTDRELPENDILKVYYVAIFFKDA